MSGSEILRIVIPALGVIVFAAILITFVRGRSARREQALIELAARDGLKYTPGGRDFYQGSWPGRVAGVYHGRKLLFQYKDKPSMTPRGYNAANYWALLEIAVRNPTGSSLSLESRRGDVSIISKPRAFAAQAFGAGNLRQRLTEITSQGRGRINLIRGGDTLTFTANRVFRSPAELMELVDALSDLADAVEAQPAQAAG